MEKPDLDLLQAKALRLLSEREKTAGLRLVHVATDSLPSTKARIVKFVAARFVAKEDPPKRPVYEQPLFEIVLDEEGNTVDPVALGKRDGVELFTRRDWSVDPAHLWRFGAADAQFTIEPAANDLILNPGDSVPETLTVSIPKQTPDTKFDVYLLADTTASMRIAIGEVKGASRLIVQTLQGMGLDVAFGVGNYTDFLPGVPDPFQHQLSPTTDAAYVDAAIAAWNPPTYLDNDDAEAQLFALDQIASHSGDVIQWRTGAKRVLVWFGDNPGHEPICRNISQLPYDVTTQSVRSKLASQNVAVIAISLITLAPSGEVDTNGEPKPSIPSGGLDADPNMFSALNNANYAGCASAGHRGQARDIASATGGIHIPDIAPAQIVSAILSAVAETVVGIHDVQLQLRDAAAQFVVLPPTGFPRVDSLSPNGLNIQFLVEFKGVVPCTREAQVFEGAIDVAVNNVVTVSKLLRVTVPQCKAVTIHGSPSAAVERNVIPERGRGLFRASRISVLARGSENQLRRCSNGGDPQDEKSWSWEDVGRKKSAPDEGVELPGSFPVDTPFAIAVEYADSQGIRDHIQAFVTGRNGHLYDIAWNGMEWSRWVDHGQPMTQASVTGSPAAIAFRSGSQSEEGFFDSQDLVATLVWGSDGGLHHRNYWGIWGWNGGLPNGATVMSAAGVVHRPLYRIYSYVVGVSATDGHLDGHLYVSYSTDPARYASSWTWVDLGRPASGLVALQRPGVVPFVFGNQNRLYAFVSGQDGNLWEHVWRGREPGSPQQMALDSLDVGAWSNQGAPDGVTISSAASVVTHSHGGNDQVYAFVRGSDRLLVNYWDAANFTWVWRDLGQPATATIRGDPSAIICEHPDRDPIYVFVRGSDGYLHMCHVDSGITRPQWLKLDVEHW